jgi:NADP-dependent 3-hydroxy acid dehydrogenase YdfG
MDCYQQRPVARESETISTSDFWPEASSGITVDLSGRLRARVVAEELAAGGTHLVVTARRRQRLTKLRRRMRSAHGVEIEVLAADLGEPRAPQPAVVSNLTVNDYRITPAGAIIEGDYGF